MKNQRLWICVIFFTFFAFHIDINASFFWIRNELWAEDRSDMDSNGLYVSNPVIISTPGNKTNYHGERVIYSLAAQGSYFGSLILEEDWEPTKPGDFHYITIMVNATGYGEIAFTLKKKTRDYPIGNWASEPLKKAEREVYSFRIKEMNGLYNTDEIGTAEEISPTTVNVSATGVVQSRSRSIVTYKSKQKALTAQASTTPSASLSFVIGESTYWKWEAGITRDVNADPYNGSYSVTINDKIRGECGIHIIDPSEAYAHAWQVNCPVNITQDGGNVYCTVKGFYRCDPSHIHQFPSSGSGSGNGGGQQGNGGGQQGNGGGVGMGQGTSNYLALGGQNGGGTPPSNGGCNTPPANGGCTTIATACINPICIRNTACATYTCIRSIIIGRRADGTAITEPCGELFTQCQNLLMQRGICSGERLTTLRDYHSDLYR